MRIAVTDSGTRIDMRSRSRLGQIDRGDLFGRDVNLVARLCDAARPGELLRSSGGSGEPEHLETRLTPEEQRDHMLICVSRARSGRLVLDL